MSSPYTTRSGCIRKYTSKLTTTNNKTTSNKTTTPTYSTTSSASTSIHTNVEIEEKETVFLWGK